MVNQRRNKNSKEKEKQAYRRIEKRRDPRAQREITLQYRIKDSSSAAVDVSRTKDLSESGVFFTASRAIAPEAIIDIRLRLPLQREPLELEGRVVSCKELKQNFIYEVRVEFINLKDEQRKLLREFVKLFLKP